MMRRHRFCFTLALIAAALPVADGRAADGLSPAALAVLRGYDLRLATIGYRLATANVALCDARAPTPGWALHAIDQYPAGMAPVLRATFGFAAPVAVEAVVAGGPAAAAGVRADDAVTAIGGLPLGAAGTKASSATRDAALAAVAAQPATVALTVTLLRGGARRPVRIAASPGCASRFEILLGPKLEASADGQGMQVGVRFLERYDDPAVAAVVAHELAHNILRHRARLEAAGVRWGLLSEYGRNGRLFRRTEEEADRLSVALLHNAGYDPAAAARFWREHGGEVDGGLFRSRTHPASKARAAAIEEEIARIVPGAVYVPSVLATRGEALE